MGRSIVSTRSLPISRQKASFSNIWSRVHY
jgi:hypothetical protein